MSHARVAAAVLVALIAFASALTGIWDPDFFHHLAVGRAVVRGTRFLEDPFLFPFQGVPASLPPYWLGSVLIYLSGLADPLVGPQLLVGALVATACVLLLVDATEERQALRDLGIGVALVLLVVPELRVRSAPRPEAFGVLFLVFTQLALRRAETGKTRLLLAFPVVALVWSQIHVSVAIGLGLVALHVAWSLVLATGARLGRAWGAGATFRNARTPALVLVAATIAASLNPSGGSPLGVATHFLASLLGAGGSGAVGDTVGSLDAMRGMLEELQPPALTDWSRPFGVLVAAALASFALHRTRHWGRELASVAALAFFASTSHRFVPIAALAAAPIAARNLLGWLDSIREGRPALARTVAVLTTSLALARAVTSPTLPLQPLGLALDSPGFPVRAAEYLRAIGFDGRLYNAFGAGGYLEWILDRKIFQDGRGSILPQDLGDVFPEPIDRARLTRLDDRWRFDALVISTQQPAGVDPALAETIARTWATAPDPLVWSLVALDEGAALYLRRAGRWAANASKDEYRALRPGGGVPVELLSNVESARLLVTEFGRAVREAPACVQCRVSLAGLLLETGRPQEAAPHLDVLDRVRSARHRPSIDVLLAMRSDLEGNVEAAERHYRAAIRGSDAPAPLRRALALRLLGRNLDDAARELIDENLEGERTAANLSLAAMLARRGGDLARAAALDGEASSAARREAAMASTLAGQRLAAAGRLAEARAAYLDALANQPGLAEPLVGLGFVELQANNPGGAAEAFDRALRIAPDHADGWLGQGLASERLGNRGRAAAAYRNVVRLRGRGPQADEAQARLRHLDTGRP